MRIATNLRRDGPATRASEWTAERPDRRSLQTLQQALRKATEALTDELCHPGTPVPQWSEEEWAVARAVAAIHGVSPLLAGTSRWRGPPAWTRFLAQQRAHTEIRFLRIGQTLRVLDERARAAGIAVLPLKGAALHALGIYSAGERPMADIDLLVREEQTTRCSELLVGMNFHETYRTWKHQVFSPPEDPQAGPLGEHAGNAVKIELHCHLAEELPRPRVDIATIVLPELLQPGLNAYPSRAALLLHLLLHTAGSMVFRAVRLLQLHDIARLIASMDSMECAQLPLLAARTPTRSLWWAFPPLALVNRYYGCVPAELLQRAATDCHWTLRGAYRHKTLADVSLSYLWISAFPGIEWARSPRAMLEYALARIVPDDETRRQRNVFAHTQPRVSGGRWSQLSQGERMLRWMLSRQARNETLQPVRAALREVCA
jgi:putative nucleotidyltransferase-like protein